MKQTQRIIEGQNSQCQYRFKIGFDVDFAKKHNQDLYFSITGETWELNKPKIDKYSKGGGALSIGEHIPDLAYLDKYHLMSIKEPMHYVANSLYHASNRDHNGLLKGEKKQIKNGKTGQLAWHLMAVDKETGEEIEIYELEKSFDGEKPPECKYRLDYRPWCKIGEGKEPDLKAARSSACWPEANLEDFTEDKLKARLPKLIEQFKKDIKKAGIAWPE